MKHYILIFALLFSLNAYAASEGFCSHQLYNSESTPYVSNTILHFEIEGACPSEQFPIVVQLKNILNQVVMLNTSFQSSFDVSTGLTTGTYILESTCNGATQTQKVSIIEAKTNNISVTL